MTRSDSAILGVTGTPAVAVLPEVPPVAVAQPSLVYLVTPAKGGPFQIEYLLTHSVPVWYWLQLKMLARSFPDWSKIGRRIGKRLRDVISPPSDTAPSKEERRAQRLIDVFKGFAYFDDFDEILTWQAANVDPIQCANVPLLPRGIPVVEDRAGPRVSLLLCHDYDGPLIANPCLFVSADALGRGLS